MNADEAKQIVLAKVRVDRADVADAKAYLRTLTGQIQIHDIALARATSVVGTPVAELRLDDPDPLPAIEQFARHVVVRFAVYKAAWELINSGSLMPWGATVVKYPSLQWADRGYRAGLDFKELIYTHPESVLSVSWVNDNTALADEDLYLTTLGATGVHPAIATALKHSVACFRSGMYVAAVAMLDAASEGAWIEAGDSLAKKTPPTTDQADLANKLADPRLSMRSKAAAVADYFDKRKDLQTGCGVKAAQLRDTLQWSGMIRDARNVLHWNVTAPIPNDYSTVATYLLAALTHIKRLHDVKNV